MKAHVGYLMYVLRHKWHVFRAGAQLGVPLWRLLIHDWTKFTPAEWGPYVRRFYAGNNSKWEKDTDPQEWKDAWKHHWSNNPHHWEYWLAIGYEPATPLEMQEVYVREMVADWYGAGMAQGKPDIAGWYHKNSHKMTLHETTRQRAEALLLEAQQKRLIP